ncbi:hypothetical protein KSF_020600 [Reticulibacter mediterranei]|uniref:Uncharacterized protein n=1 Tax=Reticulibacter mediterranei TaxID=2778369 RepID=A0A8J3N280_9CHLR|nr:hypothetical protein [Reticulibacter mediterranei]GHO92012.1 hypothetical protein KSF_020600 [Reticulibacter mediterranei]
MEAETSTRKGAAQSEGDSTLLSARSLYQHDPLLVLLKDKLHLATVWIVVGGFVVVGFCFFLLAPLFQSRFQPSVSPGDMFEVLLFTLGTTLSLLIYLLLPSWMASIFNSLKTNGVIGPSRREPANAMSYARFLEHMISRMDSWWWSLAIGVLALFYFLYGIFILAPQSLTVSPWLLLVSFLTITFPAFYTFVFGLLRMILLLSFLNQLFALFSIRVRPLSPDSSGGLAALGQLGWMGAAIMVASTLFLLAFHEFPPISLSPYDIAGATISYLTLLIVLAIGWLALPHQVMVRARNQQLQPLTEEYERMLVETRPTADEEAAQIVAGTERLAALKQRYELVQETFPIWPVQVVEMRRLAVAWLLPALMALLPSIFDVFTRK